MTTFKWFLVAKEAVHALSHRFWVPILSPNIYFSVVLLTPHIYVDSNLNLRVLTPVFHLCMNVYARQRILAIAVEFEIGDGSAVLLISLYLDIYEYERVLGSLIQL